MLKVETRSVSWPMLYKATNQTPSVLSLSIVFLSIFSAVYYGNFLCSVSFRLSVLCLDCSGLSFSTCQGIA